MCNTCDGTGTMQVFCPDNGYDLADCEDCAAEFQAGVNLYGWMKPLADANRASKQVNGLPTWAGVMYGGEVV